ncbi:hypothetical protein SETIT_2G260900v2 [Setaria italica]|uniref:DUF4283 domain-containing protein n=1 Tax=Setaria italica TaxID=4555 RepID=A0A368Q3F4_SETIT|nr:hypothetical protein SETIT_2G260900v2 [Setaria italica]
MVMAELVSQFELLASSSSLTPAELEDFPLVLPDEQTASRVYGNGRPIRAPTFRLHLKRWSRQAHAEAGSLRVLVNLTLRGVPQHAWNLRTAEHLLNKHCWVLRLLPETVDRSDLTSFKLLAWCSQPEAIPSAKFWKLLSRPLETMSGHRSREVFATTSASLLLSSSQLRERAPLVRLPPLRVMAMVQGVSAVVDRRLLPRRLTAPVRVEERRSRCMTAWDPEPPLRVKTVAHIKLPRRHSHQEPRRLALKALRVPSRSWREA